MHLLSTQGVAIWLAASLLLGTVWAQDARPGGPVHPGQPDNCNGWHTVVAGDTCQSIHTRYDISLTRFLNLNPAVSRDCVQKFQLGSAYCVRTGQRATGTTPTTTAPPTVTDDPSKPDLNPGGPVHPGQPANCNGWHTVVSGDTCQSIHTRYDISLSRFLLLNPAVSRDCVQNFWLGSAYCVSTGQRATPTTITSSSWFNSTYSTQHPITDWNITSSSSNTAWPPTKTLDGQSDLCNTWHKVLPGDTCQTILNRYGLLTRQKFLDWNPGVEEDCDELLADYWVCIGVPNRNIDTELEWETPQPDFTPPPEPTEHTPITMPAADSSFTPSPSHGPMPSNCLAFHQVESDENCNSIVNQYGYFSRQQFLQWNPALGGDCNGLWLGNWYCIGAFDELPLPSHQTTKPTSGTIPLGYPRDCTRWYFSTGQDTCENVAAMFGSFDESDFVAWNPTVRGICDELQEDAWYCVGRPATPTTRTDGALEPTHTDGPRPTQSGVAAECSAYWLVSPGDTCGDIVRQAGISLEDLLGWNTLIERECDVLEADYYICVGVGGEDEEQPPETLTTRTATSTRTTSTSTRTTATTAPTTTTKDPGTPVETPRPVREGMTEDCVRFYLQQPGDLCYSIAERAGISLSQFYEWNPAVGSECFNLWPDYFYCVGVSGPATTITDGPPVPT